MNESTIAVGAQLVAVAATPTPSPDLDLNPAYICKNCSLVISTFSFLHWQGNNSSHHSNITIEISDSLLQNPDLKFYMMIYGLTIPVTLVFAVLKTIALVKVRCCKF